MHISNRGIALIKKYEGFSDTWYFCEGKKTTIGYGHVKKSSDKFVAPISMTLAEKLLKSDIEKAENSLNNVVSIQLSQGQFDALVSLVFNWGIDNFKKSKGLSLLNQGYFSEAANEFFSKEKGVVNINGKFSKGLYNRRQAELNLYS